LPVKFIGPLLHYDLSKSLRLSRQKRFDTLTGL
jgi:hypothetical protein